MNLNKHFNLGKVLGIPIKLHWTFFLLFIYIPYAGLKIGLSPQALILFGIITLSIFLCVLMHEYGHALMARRFGIDTEDIILTPIGGIARLQNLPNKPIEEVLVAIAGPMVNVVLAFVFLILLMITGQQIMPDITEIEFLSRVEYFPVILLWINIALLIFNLIPAFPMDGGRVLRAALSMKMHKVKATRIASVIGQTLAVGFLILGVWQGQYSLPFIGIFIFLSARNENLSVKRESFLEESRIKDFIRSPYTTFNINDDMISVFKKFQQGSEKDFLVLNDLGHVIGVLHREYIEEAMKRNDSYSTVREYVSNHYLPVYENQNLRDVFTLFQTKQYSITPVYSQTYELIGSIDRDMLMNLAKSIK